jgi:hypothetical protein
MVWAISSFFVSAIILRPFVSKIAGINSEWYFVLSNVFKKALISAGVRTRILLSSASPLSLGLSA